MSLKVVLIAGLAALLPPSAAWPHHNMSTLFDLSDRVTLTGILTDVEWRNPHIELTVDVDSGGTKPQRWSIEGPGPGFFRSRNESRSNLEAALGKMVTAEVSPARSGSQSGLLRSITFSDGAVLSACPTYC